MNKTFQEIVKKIGCTDKCTTHSYGKFYDIWFAELREKPINILEIGVCVFGGGCVLSLAEYFPNATIWAVDIDKSPCKCEIFNHPRIKFFEEDAYNPKVLENFGDTKFDIILDDASHECDWQIALLKMLHPYLTDTGFYITEDCCNVHWLQKLNDIWDMGLQQTIINMETRQHYDNTLIRFDKI